MTSGMKKTIDAFHERRLELNKSLFEAVKVNDAKRAVVLIKQGAVVAPEFHYMLNITGAHLYEPIAVQ